MWYLMRMVIGERWTEFGSRGVLAPWMEEERNARIRFEDLRGTQDGSHQARGE